MARTSRDLLTLSSDEARFIMQQNGRAMVAGVVFDAVGTLIEPVPTVAVAYAEAGRRQGVDLDVGLVRQRFHRSFARVESDDLRGPLATDDGTERRRWRRIVVEVLPEVADADRAFVELWDHFGRPESWRVFDDALPTLQALAEAALPVRIASNFDGRLRPIVRGLAGLADWSDRLVISSEVGWRKPHPAFYQAACASLGLPPARVLSVGDDPENDLHGAGRAGLRAVLIDRSEGAHSDPLRLGSLTSLIAHLAHAAPAHGLPGGSRYG